MEDEAEFLERIIPHHSFTTFWGPDEEHVKLHKNTFNFIGIIFHTKEEIINILLRLRIVVHCLVCIGTRFDTVVEEEIYGLYRHYINFALRDIRENQVKARSSVPELTGPSNTKALHWNITKHRVTNASGWFSRFSALKTRSHSLLETLPTTVGELMHCVFPLKDLGDDTEVLLLREMIMKMPVRNLGRLREQRFVLNFLFRWVHPSDMDAVHRMEVNRELMLSFNEEYVMRFMAPARIERLAAKYAADPEAVAELARHGLEADFMGVLHYHNQFSGE